MLEEKIFLISPVRKITEHEKEVIGRYVRILEYKGYKVHWPLRDTVQDKDPHGLDICYNNDYAMLNCNNIRIIWNPTSEGSSPDLGTALAAAIEKGVKVTVVNKNKLIKHVKSQTEERIAKNQPTKSFERVMLCLDLHAKLFGNTPVTPKTINKTYSVFEDAYGFK